MLKSTLQPNVTLDSNQKMIVAAGWILGILGSWEMFKSPIFPSISDIIGAYPTLFSRDGLLENIIKSFSTNLKALVLSTLISLPIAYVSRVPLFEPLAVGVSKLRFLSPSVFFLIFLFLFKGGDSVKVMMLVAGISFFMTTTMVDVVRSIPSSNFDDARTLKMSEWQGLWYVVVRGTLHQALESIRQNAAIGWSMLMMVEGFVRSSGGVGVLLLNQEKFLNFSSIYAIAISIVIVGLFQDYILGLTREILCPYVRKA